MFFCTYCLGNVFGNMTSVKLVLATNIHCEQAERLDYFLLFCMTAIKEILSYLICRINIEKIRSKGKVCATDKKFIWCIVLKSNSETTIINNVETIMP